MFKRINIVIIVLLSAAIISCNKDSANLKTIQQQSVGDYIVLIKSSTGNIQKGSGQFYIDFHTATGDHFTDPGKVDVNAIMHMTGMPMSADISVAPTDQLGRREVKFNFPMSGTWILEVNFDGEKRAQFSLIVN